MTKDEQLTTGKAPITQQSLVKPTDGIQTFTLIVEPVGGCNLRCLYCYADSVATPVMDERTLRVTFERVADYAIHRGFAQIDLLWHGGEPLLAGLNFYRSAAKLAAEIFQGLHINHFLQTNGLLLDQDFCRFFRDHSFQVGISLDGFAELHDVVRVMPNGGGSHQRVIEGLHLAAKHGLKLGFNLVATRLSLGREKEIYRYFQHLGSGFRVNPLIPGTNRIMTAPYLFQPGEYGRFLNQLFTEWTTTEYQRIQVSPLAQYLKAFLQKIPDECQQQATCVGSHLGVKPSGDTVLCSRFSDHFLGNLHDKGLVEIFAHPFCLTTIRRAETLTGCHGCAHWPVCHGGCPHNALVLCGDHMVKDYFCQDYRYIFNLIGQALEECGTAASRQEC